jgi:hypothetical protein
VAAKTEESLEERREGTRTTNEEKSEMVMNALNTVSLNVIAPRTSLTQLDHLLLKCSGVGISNAILRKYGTKHAPGTIGDSGGP